MIECNLVVEEDGTLTGIYNDDLADLLAQGQATVRRASHVEPAPGGGWEADMSPVGGGVLTGFALRSEALAAEVAWLNENVLHV